MTHQDLLQEVENDTSVLRVKSAINQVKEECAKLEDSDRSVQCFSEAKDFENRMENVLRKDTNRDRIQRFKQENRSTDLSEMINKR
jgi:DNA replication protein DnaC